MWFFSFSRARYTSWHFGWLAIGWSVRACERTYSCLWTNIKIEANLVSTYVNEKETLCVCVWTLFCHLFLALSWRLTILNRPIWRNEFHHSELIQANELNNYTCTQNQINCITTKYTHKHNIFSFGLNEMNISLMLYAVRLSFGFCVRANWICVLL